MRLAGRPPQTCAGTVKAEMLSLGFKARELHPSVYWHEIWWTMVANQVGVFLCAGAMDEPPYVLGALTKHDKEE